MPGPCPPTMMVRFMARRIERTRREWEQRALLFFEFGSPAVLAHDRVVFFVRAASRRELRQIDAQQARGDEPGQREHTILFGVAADRADFVQAAFDRGRE